MGVPHGEVVVNHRRVARHGHCLTEGDRAVSQRGVVQSLGPGPAGADGLPIVDQRVVQVLAAQILQDECSFLCSLLGVDGLGEEVCAHLQPGGLGPGDVLQEVGIQIDLPFLAVAAVAQADHHEGNARSRHLLPVDLPLMGGDVNADGRGVVDIVVVHDAAVRDKEVGIVGGCRYIAQQRQGFLPVLDVPGQGGVILLRVLPAADAGDNRAHLCTVDTVG